MRTKVGIVGAGPAGLLLAHLLHRAGIASVVLELRTREHVEQRVRAGVLEQGTADLLRATGVGERMEREGLVHEGIELRFGGTGHRIPMTELTGRAITVYGQQEVVKDLIAARVSCGEPLLFEVSDVALHDLDSERPRITYVHDGAAAELTCDVIAGCDGFHGVCRPSVPDGALTFHERDYAVTWLGILVEAPPSSHELVYCRHEHGFALHSMRSPCVTRNYLQVAADASLEDWPDERIWEELHTRLAAPGFALAEGPITERLLAPLRSFVTEPMQYGRLFLAGDAAHIVPATGAKGLNLAVHDVQVLSEALAQWYATGSTALLDGYSATCLRRVWRVQDFSNYMTTLLHRLGDDPFEHRLQLSRLEYVSRSTAMATALAENYVGLPRF